MEYRQEMLERIKTAISRLEIGLSYSVDGLYFGMKNDVFFVTAATKYIYYENVTKESALEELKEIKLQFNMFLDLSQELSQIINGKSICYLLTYDTGKFGFDICSETNGMIHWIDRRLES